MLRISREFRDIWILPITPNALLDSVILTPNDSSGGIQKRRLFVRGMLHVPTYAPKSLSSPLKKINLVLVMLPPNPAKVKNETSKSSSAELPSEEKCT